MTIIERDNHMLAHDQYYRTFFGQSTNPYPSVYSYGGKDIITVQSKGILNNGRQSHWGDID